MDDIPDRVAARWLVTGRVQGVGFRWFVLQAARRHRLQGDVRNLSDGRVEVRAAGAASQIAALLSELEQGPSGARVDFVQRLEPDAGLCFEKFEIRD